MSARPSFATVRVQNDGILFLPPAEHELELDLDCTAAIPDIAPDILADSALLVWGQRQENLTGRSPPSLDMIEMLVERFHPRRSASGCDPHVAKTCSKRRA